jgi:hypothetical protein
MEEKLKEREKRPSDKKNAIFMNNEDDESFFPEAN